MSANERRAEIMRIMVARRQENMQVLASELGVSDRTIRNDIVALTAEYPLETYRTEAVSVSPNGITHIKILCRKSRFLFWNS